MAAERKDKAPAYQWYPKDYDTDEAVKLMTYEQEGVYRRLLDHQSLHGGIPSDVNDIAKLVPKIQRGRFLKLWPGIAAKFSPAGDGRLANGRMTRAKDEYAAFVDGKSEAGKRSVEVRQSRYGTAQPPNSPRTDHRTELRTDDRTAPEPAAAAASSTALRTAAEAERRNVPDRRSGGPPMNLGLRRLSVWRWMLEDLIAALGEHADAFDIELWLQDVDRSVGLLPSKTWPWLKEQMIAEASRRGLPMAGSAPAAQQFGKQSTRLLSAVAGLSNTR